MSNRDLYNNYGEIISIYDLEEHKIIKKDEISNSLLDNILTIPNHKLVLCFKIKNKEDFLYNDFKISYDDFPWKTYYNINRELVSVNKNANTKINAWNHWTTYGKLDERAFSYINNTNDHRARFGNLFFLNMCLHLFSQKFDLKSSYKYEKMFNRLGVYFYKGNNIYKKNFLLTEHNFENLLESDIKRPKNIIINNNVWFHTDRFCKIIKDYFDKFDVFSSVKSHNIFKSRYKKNNDLFIHVRLGDVTEKTQSIADYYEKTIKSLKFNKGYIASDNIKHEICQHLIKKFNLEICDKPEVETIMFGSTCNNIVLSGGTFSWLIAFLACDSKNIFYPELKEKWYGDIFSFNNDWKKNII